MVNTKKIVFTTIGLIVGGIGGYAIFKNLNTNPSKYSLEWIKRLSDAQWAKERDIVQNQYRNPELDADFRENCRRLLGLFDKVKGARDLAGKMPTGPAYHREHGFGLYKLD